MSLHARACANGVCMQPDARVEVTPFNRFSVFLSFSLSLSLYIYIYMCMHGDRVGTYMLIEPGMACMYTPCTVCSRISKE